MHYYTLILLTFAASLFRCTAKDEPVDNRAPAESATVTFQHDVDFISQYTSLHVLEETSGKGTIAISPALQARVMTSSADGMQGRSYGWINRDLFKSGDTLDHINPYGGEERFWLGPEGGQYSIFFKKDSEFTLDNWQTPALIDLEAFEVTEKTATSAEYYKEAIVTNYSEFVFNLAIRRRIDILEIPESFASLGLQQNDSIKVVGYRTTNTLTNMGKEDWRKESGLLSIWLLGMFTPSHATTVLVPFVEGNDPGLGAVVNDSYFGKVPPDRLKVGAGIIYFKGDGNARGKIGLSPKRAKDIIGSYDAVDNILTIVKYSKPENATDYVNSQWEIQQDPYQGDVVNSYNDGPLENGSKQMGPFYELESSSPALSLKVGESATHIQATYHFEGEQSHLDAIAQGLFGVSLNDIRAAF